MPRPSDDGGLVELVGVEEMEGFALACSALRLEEVRGFAFGCSSLRRGETMAMRSSTPRPTEAEDLAGEAGVG